MNKVNLGHLIDFSIRYGISIFLLLLVNSSYHKDGLSHYYNGLVAGYIVSAITIVMMDIQK